MSRIINIQNNFQEDIHSQNSLMELNDLKNVDGFSWAGSGMFETVGQTTNILVHVYDLKVPRVGDVIKIDDPEFKTNVVVTSVGVPTLTTVNIIANQVRINISAPIPLTGNVFLRGISENGQKYLSIAVGRRVNNMTDIIALFEIGDSFEENEQVEYIIYNLDTNPIQRISANTTITQINEGEGKTFGFSNLHPVHLDMIIYRRVPTFANFSNYLRKRKN